MRAATVAVVLLSAAILTACGSKSEAPRSATSRNASAKSSAEGKVTATAEEVAREARGKVKCPPKIATPERARGAPVDDVVGVRPGMTYEEAANTVMCSNELLVVQQDKSRRFNIQTYGQEIRQGFTARFAVDRVEKTSKQIMKELQDSAMARGSNRVVRDMQPGQAKWYVATMGLPGQERVISAAREEWFEAGRNPTLQSVEQALIKKYGAPTEAQHSPGQALLTWGYDPRQRPITETSPLYQRCRGTADPDGGTNFSPGCGVVVAARVQGLRENPELAEYLQVGVIDQANGYDLLTNTEQELLKLENDRRAREVEEASKNAVAPSL
jgi:hypothetical protein